MMDFNGPLKPGDKVTIEWEGRRFEAVVEEIAFRSGQEVLPGISKSQPIKLTLALIRPL